jgi:hypothetical protein
MPKSTREAKTLRSSKSLADTLSFTLFVCFLNTIFDVLAALHSPTPTLACPKRRAGEEEVRGADGGVGGRGQHRLLRQLMAQFIWKPQLLLRSKEKYFSNKRTTILFILRLFFR